MAGGSAAAAAALSAWPLAALGGAAYAALVAWDLASPDFWRKAVGPPPAAGPAEAAGVGIDLGALADDGVRDSAAAVLRSLGELRRVLGGATPDVAIQMAGAEGRVEELVSRAARLARSGDQIARYLGGEDDNAIRREIQRLEAKAAAAIDDATREQWRQAAATRGEHLQVRGELRGALERIQANLSRIAAGLDGFAGKVVRMGALDTQAMNDLSGDMNGELARLNAEVDTFEETLRPLVAAEVRA